MVALGSCANGYEEPTGLSQIAPQAPSHQYEQPRYQQPYQQPYQQQYAPQYQQAPQQYYYQPQVNPYYPPVAPYSAPQGGSRYYSNPYAIPPSTQYPHYESDQYYVPPTYYNNVESPLQTQQAPTVSGAGSTF